MLEMILGIVVGYIAFTEEGHKLGDSVAKLAVKEGKKIMERKTEKETKKNEEGVE